MIKKLSALLLSLVLCLGLIGTAFAEGESEDFTVDAQTTKVVIESDTLTPGNYPLCSIANSND